jgi:hypothetical protein
MNEEDIREEELLALVSTADITQTRNKLSN